MQYMYAWEVQSRLEVETASSGRAGRELKPASNVGEEHDSGPIHPVGHQIHDQS